MTQQEFDFATSGIIVPMLGIASLLIVAVTIASRDSRSVEARNHSSDTAHSIGRHISSDGQGFEDLD